MAVWCTTDAEITGQVDALLATFFGGDVKAVDMIDSKPTLYNSSVFMFFPPGASPGQELRDFQLVFGSNGNRVHNVVIVAGLECEHTIFFSSAGEQDMTEHPALLQLLQAEMEGIFGQWTPPTR